MATKLRTSGVVNANELYTLRQIKLRLGMQDAGMRSMRRRGFPLIRVGNRAYASGRQVIEFMEGLLNESTES